MPQLGRGQAEAQRSQSVDDSALHEHGAPVCVTLISNWSRRLEMRERFHTLAGPHLRRDLPVTRQGRWGRLALLQYPDYIAAPARDLAPAIAPGAYAVVPIDQAGWHMTEKLAVSDNISITALPAKRARAQSSRKHLATHARQLALQPRLRLL